MPAMLIQRLEAAVMVLAGHGALKDRLGNAYAQHLEDSDFDALPAPLRMEFTSLAQVLHSAPALPGDTVIRASVRKLSPEEAGRWATLIVRAYATLTRAPAPEQAMPALKLAATG